MKYRKKPAEIEAFRMGIDHRPDWFQDKVTSNEITTFSLENEDGGPFSINRTWCKINTEEGVLIGCYGDYIIHGDNGEIYPCKPEIFELTYEKV